MSNSGYDPIAHMDILDWGLLGLGAAVGLGGLYGIGWLLLKAADRWGRS